MTIVIAVLPLAGGSLVAFVIVSILLGIAIGRGIRHGYGWAVGIPLFILGMGMASNWFQTSSPDHNLVSFGLCWLAVAVTFTPGKRPDKE